MKILFTSVAILFVMTCFSQRQQSLERKLRIQAYTNKYKRIINYDKSFVSDDVLFYESLEKANDYGTLDEKLIRKVLQNYMNGSSYNKRKMLESAFAKNATLYLTGKGGFKRYTPQEYVSFFKNGVEGEFNGRNAKILNIERVKDIATAKVQISIPARGMIYIDLFLLKKLEDGWKIISKTATRIDNEE